MSALNITTDATGKVTKVMVDDKVIDNVSDVSQNLSRGTLVATIKATFDSITVTEQAGTPAPALTVAFAAGTGSTKATITGDAEPGNHFAYAVADTTHATPNVGDVVSGATTYVSGNNITGVTAGKSVAVYELTTANEVVKFTAHTLIGSEIKAAE